MTATGRSAASSTTKTDTPIIESPQTVSVISREEIELRASPTIADALAYTAGVQSEPSGIDSRVDEVSVRGFGAGGFSSNNNFVDGLRLPSGGQWTRPGFDPIALQQIEVLKGPSGALYGQTAPGGVVNIVTKRPSFTVQREIQVQAAGFTDLDHWNFQAAGDITGPIAGSSTVAGRLVALIRDGDTQVDQTDISRYYVSPSVTWAPSESTTWTFLGQYQRDRGGSTFQFLPYTGTYVPGAGGQRLTLEGYIGEPDWNTFDRDQYLIASFLEHRLSENVKLRNNIRYTHLDTLYRVTVLSGDTATNCAALVALSPMYAGCQNGATIGRRAVQGKGESDGWATDTQAEVRFATGAVEHTLLAGVDYFHTDWEHYRDLVTLPGLPAQLRGQVEPLLDMFNPSPRGSSHYPALLQPQIYTETVSRQAGLYVQDQLRVGRLRVTLGGRQDWSRDSTRNPVNGTRFVNKYDAFTWRAGAVYLFDNGFAPYVSYAESFQPQVSDPSTSLNGQSFVPTTGQQYEAGVRYQGGAGIYVTLGAYQITQQNIISNALPIPPSTVAPICGTATCQIQVGEGRVRGVELEGRANLPWGMTAIAAVTRSDAEVTKSATAGLVGKKLPQAADWLASAFVNQHIESGPLAGLGLGGGIRHNGRTYGDALNQFRMPSFTLFDVFARYDFGVANPQLAGLTGSINVRNLANKRYLATCSGVSSCFYGQGRSLTARLQYRW
ncbi:TonB-dependent siderophore receptor [Phenylobacterium sp.]|uniref:TonB-dependent siderophore receptor n=1 Tax=Phenylobacterium sp. TaxID=1871053 RepID=UPI00301E5C18